MGPDPTVNLIYVIPDDLKYIIFLNSVFADFRRKGLCGMPALNISTGVESFLNATRCCAGSFIAGPATTNRIYPSQFLNY